MSNEVEKIRAIIEQAAQTDRKETSELPMLEVEKKAEDIGPEKIKLSSRLITYQQVNRKL